MKRQHLQLKNLLIIYDCFSKKETLTYLKEQKIPYIYFSSNYINKNYEEIVEKSFPQYHFPTTNFMKIAHCKWEEKYFKVFWALDRQLNFNYNPAKMLSFLHKYVKNGLEEQYKTPYVIFELKKLWDYKIPEEQEALIFSLKAYVETEAVDCYYSQLYKTLIKEWNIDKEEFSKIQDTLIDLAIYVNKLPGFANSVKDAYFETMSMAYVNWYKKIFNFLYSWEKKITKAPHNFLPQTLKSMLEIFKISFEKENELPTSPFFMDNNSDENLKEIFFETQFLLQSQSYLEKLSSKLLKKHFEKKDNCVQEWYWEKYWLLILLDLFQMYMKKNPKTNKFWLWKKHLFTVWGFDFEFLETWGAWNKLKLIKSFELDGLDFYWDNDEFRTNMLFNTPPIDSWMRDIMAQFLKLDKKEDIPWYFYSNFCWRFPSKYLDEIWHLRSVYWEWFTHEIPYIWYYQKGIVDLKKQEKDLKEELWVYYKPKKTSLLLDIEKTFFNNEDCEDNGTQEILMETLQAQNAIAKTYIVRSFLWYFIKNLFSSFHLEIIQKNYEKMKRIPKKHKIVCSGIFEPKTYWSYLHAYQNKICYWLNDFYKKSKKHTQETIFKEFQKMFPLNQDEKALLIVDYEPFNYQMFSWLNNFVNNWWLITRALWNKSHKPQIVIVSTESLYKVKQEDYKYIFAFSNVLNENGICKLDLQKRLLHCASHYFGWREIIMIAWNQPKIDDRVSWKTAEKLFSIKAWKYYVDAQSFSKLYPFYKNSLFEITWLTNIYYLTFNIMWELDKYAQNIDKMFEYIGNEEAFLNGIIWDIYFDELLKGNKDLIKQAMDFLEQCIEKLISQIELLSDYEFFPSDDLPLAYHSCIIDIDEKVNFGNWDKQILNTLDNLAEKQIDIIKNYLKQLKELLYEFEN